MSGDSSYYVRIRSLSGDVERMAALAVASDVSHLSADARRVQLFGDAGRVALSGDVRQVQLFGDVRRVTSLWRSRTCDCADLWCDTGSSLEVYYSFLGYV